MMMASKLTPIQNQPKPNPQPHVIAHNTHSNFAERELIKNIETHGSNSAIFFFSLPWLNKTPPPAPGHLAEQSLKGNKRNRT